jgi:hypothetical protein
MWASRVIGMRLRDGRYRKCQYWGFRLTRDSSWLRIVGRDWCKVMSRSRGGMSLRTYSATTLASRVSGRPIPTAIRRNSYCQNINDGTSVRNVAIQLFIPL